MSLSISNPQPVANWNYDSDREFLKDGELKVQVFGRGFAWLILVHDSLAEASTFVEVIERQGLKVACLEGIAYRNGWISG